MCHILPLPPDSIDKTNTNLSKSKKRCCQPISILLKHRFIHSFSHQGNWGHWDLSFQFFFFHFSSWVTPSYGFVLNQCSWLSTQELLLALPREPNWCWGPNLGRIFARQVLPVILSPTPPPKKFWDSFTEKSIWVHHSKTKARSHLNKKKNDTNKIKRFLPVATSVFSQIIVKKIGYLVQPSIHSHLTDHSPIIFYLILFICHASTRHAKSLIWLILSV